MVQLGSEIRSPAPIVPPCQSTTRSFDVRFGVRLPIAACAAERKTEPLYTTEPPRRAVHVPLTTNASAWDAPEPHPLPPPTCTNRHCWLAPPVSGHWTGRAPSAVEKSSTSTALPLARLTSRTYPSPASARRNCWVAPLWSAHCTRPARSAVEEKSSTLPLWRDLSR